MTLLEHISQNIIAVYDGQNWTESTISNALEDLTFEEALRITPGSKIVLHLCYIILPIGTA
jgi:hypothetical protein